MDIRSILGGVRERGSINEEEEPERELEVNSQRMDLERVDVEKTDQSTGQVDTCRSCVGAVDPLRLWEAEKSGTCHGVVFIKET